MTQPIDKLLDGLTWDPLPTNDQIASMQREPYYTHRATMVLEGIRIRCFRLSDGQRLMLDEDVQRFLERERFPS